MSDHSSYDNVPKGEESPAPSVPLGENSSASRLNSNNSSTHCDENLSEGRIKLHTWLGLTFRVVITDGRVLVGLFNCTDKDANVVLSMCAEYLEEGKDARILGNVMIPGKHIVSISVDLPKEYMNTLDKTKKPLASAPPLVQ